jgi:predicted transcriptional regulator
MFVKDQMSHPVSSIHPEMSMVTALVFIRKEHNRCLPEINRLGKLVGIVAELGLVHAGLLDSTSLSIYEVKDLINKILVKEIMGEDVINVVDRVIDIRESKSSQVASQRSSFCRHFALSPKGCMPDEVRNEGIEH